MRLVGSRSIFIDPLRLQELREFKDAFVKFAKSGYIG